MPLVDNNKDILPLSSIAELLNSKIRTLKMYEDKDLLPLKENKTKKLYSIDDVKAISYVHYLASVKKINANGIKYILEMLKENMDEKSRTQFLNIVESKMKELSETEYKNIEVI